MVHYMKQITVRSLKRRGILQSVYKNSVSPCVYMKVNYVKVDYSYPVYDISLTVLERIQYFFGSPRIIIRRCHQRDPPKPIHFLSPPDFYGSLPLSESNLASNKIQGSFAVFRHVIKGFFMTSQDICVSCAKKDYNGL